MLKIFKNKHIKLFLFVLIFSLCAFLFSGCSCDLSFLFPIKTNSLNAPVLLIDRNKQVLQWNNLTTTDIYDVYLNDKVIYTINSSKDVVEFDYSNYITSSDLFKFSVVAKSTNTSFTDSNKSYPVIINNTPAYLNSPISKYTFVDNVTTYNSSITNNVITWQEYGVGSTYLLRIFTNSTGYIEITTTDTSYDLKTSTYDFVKEHQIIIYNVNVISDPVNKIATQITGTKEYNPDGNYQIIKIDGLIWDYYINSIEELNSVVYYNFLSKTTNYFIYFDKVFANNLSQHNSTVSAIIDKINYAYNNTFYETSYFQSVENYGKNYAKCVNENNLQFSVAVNYYEVSQCDTSQKIYPEYTQNNHDSQPYYNTYDYETNGKRSKTYNEFVSDKYLVTQVATTTEQLMLTIESKVTPICTKGSRADLIYNMAKDVLREIISPNMTDYEKALTIFDWLTYNTTYDYYSLKKSDTHIFTLDCCYYLEGVFLNKLAVCDGYSKAYSLMCNMEGIECIRIVGDAVSASGSGGHAWNKVKINDEYYVVDITWTEITADKKENLAHKYFLVTENVTGKTHLPFINRDRFFMYTTSLNPEINYYKQSNISYIDTNGQTIHVDQYIDTTQKLTNALNFALYTNSEVVEFALDYNYLCSLKEKYNTDSKVKAFQQEMKAKKFSAQLISQYYDYAGIDLNFLPFTNEDFALVSVMETALLVNENTELEKIITTFANYAKVNPDVLTYDIQVSFDRDYLKSKYNITEDLGTDWEKIDSYVFSLINGLSNLNCKYSFTCNKTYEEMYLNNEETISRIYHYTLKITEAVKETLSAPVINLSNNNYLTWQAIKNASGYNIYINGQLHSLIQNNKETFSLDLSPILTEAGEYEINIEAVGDDINYKTSQSSNIVNYIVLQSPEIWIADSSISWIGVDHATKYQLLDEENKVIAELPKNSYNNYSIYLPNYLNIANTYNLKVVAIMLSENQNATSQPSNIISYTILQKPEIEFDKTKIKWEPISGATNYLIYVDNLKKAEIVNNYYELTNIISTSGTYNINVVASNSGKNYEDSEKSNTLSYTKLASPVISWSGTNITWSNIANATSYSIIFGNIKITDVTTNTFDASSYFTNAGTYENIFVVANTTNNGFDGSNQSNSLTFNYLASPTLTFNGTVLSWGAVENAVNYSVFNGSAILTTTDNTLCDLSNFINDSGSYTIKVVANNTNNGYKSSEEAYIDYKKLQAPTIYYDNACVCWNNINDAEYITIYIHDTNNNLLDTVTTQSSYHLSNNTNFITTGVYNITATANSYQDGVDTSNISNSLQFNFYSAPTINLSDTTISWNALNGYTGDYDIYVDDVLIDKTTSNSYDLVNYLSDGKKHTIYIKIFKIGTDCLYSGKSNIINVGMLQNPFIWWEGTVLSWENISNATNYEVYINGNKYTTVYTNIDLKYIVTNSGTFDVYVIAINNTSEYNNSEKSNTLSYTKLASPVISWSGTNITWSNIANATSYSIIFGNIKITDVTTNTFDASSYFTNAGTYENIFVVANTTNNGFDGSNQSNSLTFNYLASPTLTFNGTVLSWGAVENAVNYSVFNGSAILTTTDNTLCDLSNFINDSGSYTIKVVANNTNNGYKSSEEAYIDYKKLSTPTISLDQTNITWQSITNAEGYTVIITDYNNNQLNSYNCNNTSFDIADTEYYLIKNNYKIYVCATTSQNGVDNSTYSNFITFDVLSPTISINNTTISWDALNGYTESYDIYVDDQLVGSTTSTTYDLVNYLTNSTLHNIYISLYQSTADKLILGKSNIVNYGILSSPTIAFTNSILNWDTVSGATNYQVYVDNELIVTVSNSSYDISNIINTAGIYNVYVIATNPNSNYQNSAKSNILQYTNLAKASIQFTKTVLNWTAITNAINYEIYIDNTKFAETTNTSFDLTNLITTSGSYEIFIKSTANTDGYYSEKSNTLSYTKLASPVISWSGTNITWSNVANATSYSIVFGNIKITDVTTNTFDASSYFTNAGTYENIFVVANTTNNGFDGSNQSNSLTFNYLKAPTISFENTNVKWNNIENATNYSIYINGAKKITTSNTTYNLANRITTQGTYEIQVIANNTNNGYKSSIYSNALSYTKLASPTLDWSGTNITWQVVDNALSYNLNIYNSNDTLIDTVNITSNSYNISNNINCQAAGTYKIHANAVSDENGVDNSNTSSIITYKVVQAPTIKNSDIIIYWDALEGYTSNYTIYLDNNIIATTKSSTFALTTISVNIVYSVFIEINQISDGCLYKGTSNILKIYITRQLDTPTITCDLVHEYIEWQGKVYAETYDVYLDNSYLKSTTNTSLNFSDLVSDYEPHSIYIKAIDNDNIYTDSDASNTVNIEITDPNSRAINFPLYTDINTPNNYSIVENSLLGPNVTQTSNGLTWDNINGVQYYVVSIYVNYNTQYCYKTIYPYVDFDMLYNIFGLASNEIVAYNVATQIEYNYYTDSLQSAYFNPYTNTNYNTVYAFDGDLNDYYIESQEEMNNIVYYSFITRKSETIVLVETELMSSINTLFNTAFNSFSETSNFSYSGSYTGNVVTITMNFDVAECDPDYYDSHPNYPLEIYENYKNNAPFYEIYNYQTERADDYDNFISDQKFVEVEVETSEELYFAVEYGFKPICKTNSMAETIYNLAKATLKNIISDDMTTFEKALTIYDWIACNTNYEWGATSEYVRKNINSMLLPCFYLEGVFIAGYAVCDGFSKAFSLLCNMEGVECIRIVGDAWTGAYDNNGNKILGGHAWNKVKIDGNYYGVDITWTDLLKNFGTEESPKINELFTHNYFLVSDSYMQDTHFPHEARTKFFNYTTPQSDYNYYYNTTLTYNTTTANFVITGDADLKNFVEVIGELGITKIEILVDDNYLSTILNSGITFTDKLVETINSYNQQSHNYYFKSFTHSFTINLTIEYYPFSTGTTYHYGFEYV